MGPAPALPPKRDGEAMAEDYTAARLPLRSHPLALLRPALDRLGLSDTRRVVALRQGGWIRLPGLVQMRQRPGTARPRAQSSSPSRTSTGRPQLTLGPITMALTGESSCEVSYRRWRVQPLPAWPSADSSPTWTTTARPATAIATKPLCDPAYNKHPAPRSSGSRLRPTTQLCLRRSVHRSKFLAEPKTEVPQRLGENQNSHL